MYLPRIYINLLSGIKLANYGIIVMFKDSKLILNYPNSITLATSRRTRKNQILDIIYLLRIYINLFNRIKLANYSITVIFKNSKLTLNQPNSTTLTTNRRTKKIYIDSRKIYNILKVYKPILYFIYL